MSNPWFRMYGDVINDPKVMRLPEGLRWRWVALLCLASRNDGTLPALADIAFALRISEDEAGAGLWDLNAAGLIDEVEPGIFAPHNWAGRQYKSDNSTSRVREYRDRQKKQEGNVSGNGDRNVSVTPPEQNRAETEQNSRPAAGRPEGSDPRQIDLEEAIKAAPSREPSRFDEFWKAYPRRKGDNPRKTAETKFNSLVKTGLDPQMLIDAIGKYAAEKADKIGTEFIPMASTWLNQQRWSDHAAVAALQAIGEAPAHEMAIEDAVRMFAKNGYWSRHAGARPGEPACRASAELLEKYGLDILGRRLSPAAAA